MITKAINNVFYMSRRRMNKMNSCCIVYVNGELYKYHDEIEYQITNIGIPLKDIKLEDEILIQIFIDCNNKEYDMILTEKDNIVNYSLLSSSANNIRFYTHEFEGKHLYDLPPSVDRPYVADFDGSIIDNETMSIELINPYLYGKSLKMVSKRQFRYSRVILQDRHTDESGIEFYLQELNQTEFRYCTDFGHYIMFYNGRRLYNNEACIKFTGIDSIYDKYYIVITKDIPAGDYIDIFYVPDIIQEVYYDESYPSDGYLSIQKERLLNTLHPELCGIFVNGKLVNPRFITNLDSDTIKITHNINTLGAVSVVKYNMYDNLISTLFDCSNDTWSRATKLMPKEVLDTIIGDSEDITDDEDNIISDNPDLIWVIIKKFWIDKFGRIDASKLFQYNDDPRVLRKSKTIHHTIESVDYLTSGDIEYIKYIDDISHIYHKFSGTGSISIGNFENLDINKKYSVSFSVLFYMDILDGDDRIYCELYNGDTVKRIPLYYNSEQINSISDIPKCYYIRLYIDDIPFTEDLNNIRIVCNTKNKEYVRFKNSIVLEEGECAIRNVECIPIDASIKTGCTLPYGIEFDKE